MTGFSSSLYFGKVEHHRYRPKSHHLSYNVFALLLDLSEIETLNRSLRLFSRNRFNVFGFYDRDHGPGDGNDLRYWINDNLLKAGIDLSGGKIEVLCYPRIFGYVFNPLSVFYCYGAGGDLRATLYEVHNTFGERHAYLIPVESSVENVIRQECEKNFYVSPFIEIAGWYHFRLSPPADTVSLEINHIDTAGSALYAVFQGTQVSLTDKSLLKAFLKYPLMTLKVIAGIHWEALKIWRKKIPVIDHPLPPSSMVTIVNSTSN
ncbi:MAG: DUF1365 domain-containing protein [Rhodospirillales bacterium]